MTQRETWAAMAAMQRITGRRLAQRTQTAIDICCGTLEVELETAVEFDRREGRGQ